MDLIVLLYSSRAVSMLISFHYCSVVHFSNIHFHSFSYSFTICSFLTFFYVLFFLFTCRGLSDNLPCRILLLLLLSISFLFYDTRIYMDVVMYSTYNFIHEQSASFLSLCWWVCVGVHTVRKFNWVRYCLAKCDEIFGHFPPFD